MNDVSQLRTGHSLKQRIRRDAIVFLASGSLVVLGWIAFVHEPGPRLNRLPVVRQATGYTCGAAALQSILAYYGEDVREEVLARELKSDPDQGTNHHEIERFARARGFKVDTAEGMTVADLRRAAEAGHPVIVAFQAWGDNAAGYANAWEDGHYAVVIGADDENVYFMDPSTTGNYTFIRTPEFLSRWHDYYLDEQKRRVELVHFGMIFSSRAAPLFDPESILPLQ
jgi:predicted double-glycine peptidase